MIAFLFIQAVLNIALVMADPDLEGIYTFKAQLVPFLCALPFLFSRTFRLHFSKMLYGYCGLGFLSLALDYTLRSHVGLIQLVTVFGPLALYGLFRFAVWNAHRCKEKESLYALALSSIGWGFSGLALLYSLFPGSLSFCGPTCRRRFLLRSGRASFTTSSITIGFTT